MLNIFFLEKNYLPIQSGMHNGSKQQPAFNPTAQHKKQNIKLTAPNVWFIFVSTLL
jgi:hypothetical protein